MRLVKGFALAALLLPLWLWRGNSPRPAERMDAATADGAIKVIVTMTEQAPIAQLNQSLKQERASLDRRHREVILSLQDVARSQTALRAWLDSQLASGAVRGYTPHWIANLIVVSATPATIAAIAARPDVDFVELDFQPELIKPIDMPSLDGETSEAGTRGIGVPPGVRALNAPQVWYELGITGAGRLVANLDTGVDGNHPALSARWRGLHAPASECWLDVLGGGTTFPVDNYGHGTHVMGTITGRALDDSVGVAPGAEWIACNAIDQGVGSGFDSDVIAAFEWFADPDGNPFTTGDVPDVVQNSWRINEGFGGGYTDCDSRWWAVIDGVRPPASSSPGRPATRFRAADLAPPDRAATIYNSSPSARWTRPTVISSIAASRAAVRRATTWCPP
jgi:hypothetical protein